MRLTRIAPVTITRKNGADRSMPTSTTMRYFTIRNCIATMLHPAEDWFGNEL
jgi:hypothetical protein